MEEKKVVQTGKVEEKEKRSVKEIVSKVVNILLWIVLFAWMAIVLVDYFHVRNEEKPQFCLKNQTTNYEDGTVTTCTGLGYKVIDYKRPELTAIEFGPFWIKDRTAKTK